MLNELMKLSALMLDAEDLFCFEMREGDEKGIGIHNHLQSRTAICVVTSLAARSAYLRNAKLS